MATEPLPPDVTHWEGPGLDAWRAWTPHEAAARLQGFERPWCVAAGWAIDLFLGRQTREHSDLEIAISRPDFAAIRACLAAFSLYSVGDGEVRRLPADQRPPRHFHQNWVLDEEAQQWRMDIFLEPGDATTWICRRDRRLRLPRAEVVGATPDGLRYLRPQAVLLFKAKAQRPKDDADLAACLPHMDAGARRWLAEALALVHPGHAWLAAL